MYTYQGFQMQGTPVEAAKGGTRAALSTEERTHAAIGTTCPPGTLSRWQAETWPSPTGRSSGSSTRQRSNANGQRVWKRQPVGGLIGLGTSPVRMMRWRFAVGSGT